MSEVRAVARRLAILAVAAFGPAACAIDDAVATYELAFVSDREGGELEIFLTTLGTTEVRNISSRAGAEYGLAWSPDGQRLLFTASYDGNGEVYLMAADGSAVVNLTNNAATDGGPSFAPDGRSIVFTSRRHAPDGGHTQDEVYVMRSDGADVRRLTTNELYDATPRYAPDGRTLAFCRQLAPRPDEDEAGNGAIFLMTADGDDERRLTFVPGFDCLPAWSPDGRTIAFHRCATDGCGIWVIEASGAHERPLVVDGHDNRWPMWSPDGRYVAYTSVRDDQTDVWIVNADGTGGRALTTHPGRDEIAAWRPRGP